MLVMEQLQTLWQSFFKNFVPISDFEGKMFWMFRLRLKNHYPELGWVLFKCSKYRNGFLQKNRRLNLLTGPHLFPSLPPPPISCTESWLFPSGVGKGPSRIWIQPPRRKRIQHGLIHPPSGWGWASSQGWESPCEFGFSNQFVDAVDPLICPEWQQIWIFTSTASQNIVWASALLPAVPVAMGFWMRDPWTALAVPKELSALLGLQQQPWVWAAATQW